ncbi:helix-turn-helix domain-containing protein [Rhodococcus qingshengii]|nr:helix-turn-helix domain-containing protein [Rhodococcus qingshengii]
MTIPSDLPERRFVSKKDAAAALGVTPLTITRMIQRGDLKGYAINSRLHRVDLNEVLALVRPMPGPAVTLSEDGE